MISLVHLVYVSVAQRPFSGDEMLTLLDKSRVNNKRLDLSGMLLHENGSFFQVLEGSPERVDELFSLIAKDQRHAQITTIIREPIVRRSFSEWTMGFAEVSRKDLLVAGGINDFFAEGSCLRQMNSGRAKKLLEAFGNGRWRARLNPTDARTSPAAHTFA